MSKPLPPSPSTARPALTKDQALTEMKSYLERNGYDAERSGIARMMRELIALIYGD